MPFLFNHVEYCDMHYVYGYCDGNASAAVNEYKMWGAYVLQDYMKVSQTSKCFIQTISIVQFKARSTTSVCYET